MILRIVIEGWEWLESGGHVRHRTGGTCKGCMWGYSGVAVGFI